MDPPPESLQDSSGVNARDPTGGSRLAIGLLLNNDLVLQESSKSQEVKGNKRHQVHLALGRATKIFRKMF